VLAKFERARDPESGHVQAQYYADIADVEAPDAHTVVFRLGQLNSEFLFNLARPESVIGPAGRVEEQDVEPIGTGPFRFTEWERGVAVRLERFEDYYLEELPYLDQVTFRFITDPQAQLAALQAGDIDVIGYGMSPENAMLAQGEPNLKTVIGSATTPVVLAMNNARAPFDDIRVRQAVQHAINKQELVEGVMLGLGQPIGSHRTPVEPCYVDLSEMYPHDPARAGELLAEAGYGADNPLRFTLAIPAAFAYARSLGEASASQLARVGIVADIEIIELSTWLSRVFRGHDYDMSIIGHSEPNDINIYANPEYYFQYNSQAFRDTYETYLRTADADEACGIMEELQRIIANDAVNVWIMELPYIAAMQQDVAGWWENQPSPSLNVTEVYREQ
jgi:peptide/nickel transport system substrate-binding protein